MYNRDYGVTVANTFEIAKLHKTLTPKERKWSLQFMIDKYLDRHLDKEQELRNRSWEYSTLSGKAKEYAANDAFVNKDYHHSWVQRIFLLGIVCFV